jgi:hypothetical protein
MDELNEQRRVGPGDALVYVLQDLERSALSVRGSVVSTERWIESAVDLLACLPDMAQRMSWAIALAQAVTLPLESAVQQVAGYLLGRAEEVRRCRV